MLVGHNRARSIPIWSSLALGCYALFALAACSNSHSQAAEDAILAQQAYEKGDLGTARHAIARAIAERDDIVAYHLLRGRIELAMESPSGAYDAFNDALALDPTNGQALLAVAELGLTTGHLRESLEASERVLTLSPDQLDALLLRGIHSIVKRDYAEAIEYGDKILALSPGHEGGAILKARALFMSRRPEEALSVLDKISAPVRASEAASLTRMEIYRAMRNPAGMLAEFERLRDLRRDDLPLRLDEANLRYKRNDRNQAAKLVTTVLSTSETSAEQAEAAVSLLQEYGAREVGGQDLARISTTGSLAARQALARFFLRQGRTAEAASLVEQMPPTAGAGLRARLLLLEGRSDQARRVAQTVIDRDATDCDALIAASQVALAAGKGEEALRQAQIASAECPAVPGGWLAAAEAYQKLGRDSGAQRIFVQALDSNKQSSELTRAYTGWLLDQGRPREAVAMARRLTRYAPALLTGWRLYGELCRELDPGCIGAADRGMANARTLFGIDLPPGTPPPNGLFGRLVQR